MTSGRRSLASTVIRRPRLAQTWLRAGLPALVLAVFFAGAAEARCVDEVSVIGATATFQTQTFRGRPQRRDARVGIELRSTSTSAITAVDLGIFLGASLEAVQTTRASALPTQQPRVFDDGGLAFRARAEVVLPPGATRTVVVERRAVPLDEDLYGVKAVVVGCSKVHPVGDVQVLVSPDAGDGDPPAWLLFAAAALTVAVAVALLRRLR